MNSERLLKAICTLRASLKTLGMTLNTNPQPSRRDKMAIRLIHDALDKTEEFNNVKERQMKTNKTTESPIIQKIRAYGLTMMSGTDNECEEVLKEIVEMLHHDNLVETKLPEARAKVFDAIGTERHYQEIKWGRLEDHPQTVGSYLTLLRVHLSRAENAWAGSVGNESALDCIRKVLAIGIACGEQHGLPRRKITVPATGYPKPQINLEDYREAGSSLDGEGGWNSRLGGADE